MDTENGWFQLEVHSPVTKAQPEYNGVSAGRPAVENSVPKGANPMSRRHTYEQRPLSDYPANRIPQYSDSANRIPQYSDPENRMPVSSNLPVIEHSRSVSPMPNTMDKTDAADVRHGYEWEQKTTPAPNAMQQMPADWADEMSLRTRHAQTVGARGPVLIQDSILHETLGIFINKKIPERPVHTKGFGAFGIFQTMNSMREYSALPFLQSPGQQVPAMVRFSFAVSTKGTPDTVCNLVGFST